MNKLCMQHVMLDGKITIINILGNEPMRFDWIFAEHPFLQRTSSQRAELTTIGTSMMGGSIRRSSILVNNFNAHIKTAQQRIIIQSNTLIVTLAVDGWVVTFGTAMRGLDSSLYQM